LAELLASDVVESGCSADFVDGSGLTPLGHAARLDSTATIEALLDAPEQVRANIDFQSPVDGRTALHVAAFYGSLDALELLLRRGADAELRDNAGVCVREQAEEQLGRRGGATGRRKHAVFTGQPHRSRQRR
jgi:ankyrin repeat protein